jgi:hypothetical protein
MSEEGYVFLIMAFILLALLIIAVYLYYKKSSETIEPSRCPQVSSNYGAIPGKSGKSVFLCGNNGTSECSFTINSLTDAIKTCNNYLNVCRSFSYSPSLKNMKFISDKNSDTLLTNNNYDTYMLQFNIIIE